MKIGKKLITLMLVLAMLVTCIPMQQVNAKTTGAKVAVTRAEWVSALLKQADIKAGKISKYHFLDTKKNAKGKAIETAYARGILPVKKKSKKFYPNKAATREFMAVTAVRALGFQADKGTSPKCKDKKTLNYPSEDKVALNQKILSLKKKKFLPNKAITKSEKKNALRVVKKIRNTGKVDSKHKNVVKYQKNVDNISASTQTNYTVKEQGNQLVVSVSKNEYTQNLQTGKVVIFPKESGTQNQIALKIKNITDTGNGRVEITGETPDIAEVYQKIDLQKKKQVDMSAFVPNDDVVASVGNLSNGLKGATAQVTTSVGNGKTLELKEMKLGDAGTFSGSVQLPAPKITAVVDADFSNPLNPIYREISVSLSEDVVAKAELKFSSKGKGTGKIYLGHVSAYLGEGFYADVVFYLNISADGKATIQYTLSNTLTASYINGDFRMNASCNGSWDGTQAEVNGQLLGEPQVNLRFLGCWFDDKLYGAIDIIGVQADAGAKLKATATVHDTKPKLCTNLDLYGYASVGVNTDFGIGKWLKNHTKLTLTKVILDDNAANPLRRTWHYEDGKRAEGDKCTYKKDERKNALKAYQKFLKKYQSAYKYSDDENIFITNSEDHKYCSGFMIKDMNGDNIPELIIDHFESFKSWSTYVFTFKNGKIKEVTKEAIDGSYNAGGYMETYFCKENHLHVHYLYGLLGEWNTAYSINKKGELYKYLEFERIIKNIDDWDTEREKQNYKYKGEKIGKSRYQKIEKKCGSNKYYWRENTEKERSKII
ncbi:MAG: S-layer homology domain-containing protein [Lachnobacterium sp.]|nr:S-layer homology domain-containing protein [Lachnobacterium sp.]